MLAKALKFTHDDLRANREGYMTQEQRKQLRRSGINVYLPAVVGAVILSIAFLFLLTLFLNGQYHNQLLLLLGILGLMILWLVRFAYLQWRKLKADLEKGDVKKVAGRVRFNIFQIGNRIYNRTVRIERERFHVSTPVLLAFKNGERYRVYYAPNTKTPLSAERVPENEPLPEAFQ